MERKGKVLMKKYEIGRLLGQGNFAKVYYARSLQSGQCVAIKVINKGKVVKVGLIDHTKREIAVMRLVKHPNIVQLYEVMATKTRIYFVLEYVKGGELFHKVSKGRLNEDMGRQYFQQLISAVDYCHRRGVYHRDLKPENLLLDENGTLKISDFGLSALSESKRQDGMLHTTCGTPAYVAPEVLARQAYDGAKADIWSCGVILYVLLAGYLPFHDRNLIQMYKKIGRAEYKCPGWFSYEVRRLLSRILNPHPSKRIVMSKIMEWPWFSKGFDSQPIAVITEVEKPAFSEADAAFDNCDSSTNEHTTEAKQELTRPKNLNAFDIISLSTGFDLSGLFVEEDTKKEVKFTSVHSASSIVSKVEEIAQDGWILKLEKSEDGKKGTLAIEAEIFEFTPSFHLVEMKNVNGEGTHWNLRR